MSLRAKINHPDIGKTGGNSEACQPHGIADVAFMQMKPAAFLVGKESFNVHALLIPVTSLFTEFQSGDQIKRVCVLCRPAEHDLNWPIRLCGEENLVQREAPLWLNG